MLASDRRGVLSPIIKYILLLQNPSQYCTPIVTSTWISKKSGSLYFEVSGINSWEVGESTAGSAAYGYSVKSELKKDRKSHFTFIRGQAATFQISDCCTVNQEMTKKCCPYSRAESRHRCLLWLNRYSVECLSSHSYHCCL